MEFLIDVFFLSVLCMSSIALQYAWLLMQTLKVILICKDTLNMLLSWCFWDFTLSLSFNNWIIICIPVVLLVFSPLKLLYFLGCENSHFSHFSTVFRHYIFKSSFCLFLTPLQLWASHNTYVDTYNAVTYAS